MNVECSGCKDLQERISRHEANTIRKIKGIQDDYARDMDGLTETLRAEIDKYGNANQDDHTDIHKEISHKVGIIELVVAMLITAAVSISATLVTCAVLFG